MMIKSMTGFGRGKYENEGRNYTVEIKSVNHKYSDISVKLPRFLNSVEDKVRKRIAQVISRGKIDVYISFENYSSKGINIRINKELAKAYIHELKVLAEEADLQYDINVLDISKFPEILKIEEDENEEQIISELMIAVDNALEKFIAMREIEGQKLMEDMIKRIEYVQQTVEEIAQFSTGLVEDYIVKLEARVNELLKTTVVEKERIAQEIVIFSDKSSIEEELTRLRSHIVQFLDLSKQSSPIGKKFDFLVQEMNREINTIGSKANCLEITKRVIEVKTEIENIREQIQNIE